MDKGSNSMKQTLKGKPGCHLQVGLRCRKPGSWNGWQKRVMAAREKVEMGGGDGVGESRTWQQRVNSETWRPVLVLWSL